MNILDYNVIQKGNNNIYLEVDYHLIRGGLAFVYVDDVGLHLRAKPSLDLLFVGFEKPIDGNLYLIQCYKNIKEIKRILF